jgi:hypothetical protein
MPKHQHIFQLYSECETVGLKYLARYNIRYQQSLSCYNIQSNVLISKWVEWWISFRSHILACDKIIFRSISPFQQIDMCDFQFPFLYRMRCQSLWISLIETLSRLCPLEEIKEDLEYLKMRVDQQLLRRIPVLESLIVCQYQPLFKEFRGTQSPSHHSNPKCLSRNFFDEQQILRNNYSCVFYSVHAFDYIHSLFRQSRRRKKETSIISFTARITTIWNRRSIDTDRINR